MTESGACDGRTHHLCSGRAAQLTALALLGAALLGLRLPGSGRSLWHDEAFTALNYIGGGPAEIWDAAAYVPNNHVLYSLLAWIGTAFGATSELALRLWSVLPGVGGALLLCSYVWRRLDPHCAVALASLIAMSSLHQELTVQARGYGLAFFFGCVLFLAADSHLREPDRFRWLVLAAFAGWAGAATINVFALTTASVFIVLLVATRTDRRHVLGAAALTGLAILAWWAPLLPGILDNADQQYGRQLSVLGAVGGWVDDLALTEVTDALGRDLDPAAANIDLSSGVTAAVRLAVVSAVFVTARRLVREGRQSRLLLLGAPLVLSYVVLGLGRFYVSPRFTFHLLPFFLVAIAYGASGSAFRGNGSLGRTAVVGLALVFVALPLARRVDFATEARRLPLEAFADAAGAVSRMPRDVPVASNTARSTGLAYYLDRPFAIENGQSLELRVCRGQDPVIVIDHPFRSQPLTFTCNRRSKGDRIVFPQRIRGPHIVVWYFPTLAAT